MREEHIKQIREGNSKIFYVSKEWLAKREEILNRDNYECQKCKEEGRLTIQTEDERLEIHHIRELETNPELGLESDNLITVCKNCHNDYHNRFGSRKENKIDREIPEMW